MPSIPRDEDFDDQIKDLNVLFSVILTMSNGTFYFHVTLTPKKNNQPTETIPQYPLADTPRHNIPCMRDL